MSALSTSEMFTSRSYTSEQQPPEARGATREATPKNIEACPFLRTNIQAINYGSTKQKKGEFSGLAQRRHGHFDVEAMLKMTTGWGLDHMAGLLR